MYKYETDGSKLLDVLRASFIFDDLESVCGQSSSHTDKLNVFAHGWGRDAYFESLKETISHLSFPNDPHDQKIPETLRNYVLALKI